MRHIRLIGIGAGDPDYLTLQAVAALRKVDVFFLLAKGSEKRDLADLRLEILSRHLPADGSHSFAEREDPPRDVSGTGAAYRAAIEDWRRRRADRCAEMIAELGEDECGAFLVWGDPTLYDSTLDILEDIRGRGALEFSVEVIPGISAVSSLCARHAIGLNRVGRAVQVTPGRLLAAGWPDGADDVVVMLDAKLAFRAFVDAPGMALYWGAYLGTPDEILIAGPLAEVCEEVVRVRAAARERKGWMFDTYLLRRAV